MLQFYPRKKKMERQRPKEKKTYFLPSMNRKYVPSSWKPWISLELLPLVKSDYESIGNTKRSEAWVQPFPSRSTSITISSPPCIHYHPSSSIHPFHDPKLVRFDRPSIDVSTFSFFFLSFHSRRERILLLYWWNFYLLKGLTHCSIEIW